MITHAFFKALLFLGAGAVIHGLHDEQDMRRMGALRKWMPVTASTFIVGWLAIAGIPPFAGFWSKDEILANVWENNRALWAIGFVTAGLTAYYMSRQVYLVFYGKPRWAEARPEATESDQSAHVVDDEQHPEPAAAPAAVAVDAAPDHVVEPHEAPWTMLLPLVVLAFLSIVGGALNLPWRNLEFLRKWLEPVFAPGALHELHSATAVQVALTVITTLLCIAGIVAAYLVYLRHRVPAEKVEPEVLEHAWYVDEGVPAFVGGPGEEAFELTTAFDRNVIDGAVNGVGALVKAAASKLRLAQSGYVRNYALGVAVGAVILIGLFLGRV
jgi:NADH-quinone oxidoreductase subunit L